MHNNFYELHGIGETRAVEGRGGVLLQRVPEELRIKLRPGAQREYLKTAGAEIRFTIDEGDSFSFTVSNHIDNGRVKVFFGDYEYKEYIVGSEPQTISVKFEPIYFANNGFNLAAAKNFGRKTVRLMLDGNEMHLHGVSAEAAHRPTADELPKLKHLAYGTSITQGYKATSPSLCYAYLTAEALGADLFNFGCSGNAFCEPELAHYLAEQPYDYATFELSVNMFNGGLSLEEYTDRIRYFIKTIAEKSAGRPIFCISIFRYFFDMGLRKHTQQPKGRVDEFRDAYQNIVSELGMDNLHFIDGRELMKDFTGLYGDLLHPSNKGMSEIASNLVPKIRAVLKGQDR
ncbi:MAG: SGNH/GDSL hydrolase family protein [Bacillota bacterium]|nr:SGNH/GDSL hydrolase family protein [Bacillota bacterium]